MLNSIIDMPQQERCVEGLVRTPSILVNLKQDKARMEARLADINAAIEALESNPEINRVLELVAKARY